MSDTLTLKQWKELSDRATYARWKSAEAATRMAILDEREKCARWLMAQAHIGNRFIMAKRMMRERQVDDPVVAPQPARPTPNLT